MLIHLYFNKKKCKYKANSRRREDVFRKRVSTVHGKADHYRGRAQPASKMVRGRGHVGVQSSVRVYTELATAAVNRSQWPAQAAVNLHANGA